MRFMQKIVPAIVTASLLIGITGGSALADTATPPRSLVVHCDQGTCAVEMGLEGVSALAKAGAALGISALQQELGALSAGARLDVDDTLTLSLPVGKIVLPKAQLAMEIGTDNRIERLHGTAEMSFPTLGALSDVRVVQPAMVEVGLETGKSLSHLHASLDPARQYLFFNIASGFDMTSKVDDTGDSLDLTAPAGQQITLVIDTEQPLVYLAGNVLVKHSGQMALVGPLLDVAQKSELIPDALPTQQRTHVTVSTLAGKGEDSYLKLGGAWVIDAGAFVQPLGIEAKPLAVEGLLTLTPKGMLLEGVVRSSIEPETVFDGEAKLTAFIPFKGDLADAFVEADATVAIPLAKVDAGANARITWPLEVEATAHVTTPFSADVAGTLPAVDPTAATRPTVKRILHSAPLSLRGAAQLRDFVASAGELAAQGAHAVGNATAHGGDWIARNAAAGFMSITRLLPSKATAK